jgi:hypothetical protein
MPETTATVFFMGTSHEVGRQFAGRDHLFTALQRDLVGAAPIMAGPGAPRHAPGGYGTLRGTGFGTGWQNNVTETLSALIARQAENPPLEGVNPSVTAASNTARQPAWRSSSTSGSTTTSSGTTRR